MRIVELYRNPTITIDERRSILEIVENMVNRNQREELDAVANLFANFRYRDADGEWVRGIPFSVNPEDLNTAIAIVAQSDEMATKRLKRKILELTNG